MTELRKTDFYTEVAKGNVDKHSLVHKFGAGNVGTTITPVTNSLTYQTPTTAQSLELVSDNVADAQNGVGAREITIIGLNSAWEEVSLTVNTHATDGTIAVALGTDLIRLYRWYVSSSGTYATDVATSHQGELTIQASGGGTVWSTIHDSPITSGQSEIGNYTIPINKTGYLLSKKVSIEGTKQIDLYFFQRPHADDVTTPYSGTFRLVEHEVGLTGVLFTRLASPNGPFVGPCDVGFMASVSSGTSQVSVEFELLIVDD